MMLTPNLEHSFLGEEAQELLQVGPELQQLLACFLPAFRFDFVVLSHSCSTPWWACCQLAAARRNLSKLEKYHLLTCEIIF